MVGLVTARAETGKRGEEAAAAFLAAEGWTIVARNARVREGEVDIVARRDGVLVFVEVKTRRGLRFGTPAEAVTPRKAARIRILAARLIAERGLHAPEIRFDVIEVVPSAPGRARLVHIEGAF